MSANPASCSSTLTEHLTENSYPQLALIFERSMWYYFIYESSLNMSLLSFITFFVFVLKPFVLYLYYLYSLGHKVIVN